MTDQAQRLQAINGHQSFIVQAPAGSGKTELLTQRYLRLLSQVQKAPEEILAITFTRKAVSEMRARILTALENAAYGVVPSQPHKRLTWQLAVQALKRDQALSWHLLDNPNRLRIQTIDSFCAYLVKQVPIMLDIGATTKITNQPLVLYRKAIGQLLAQLDDNDHSTQALQRLLSYYDNQLALIQTLLVNMLATRDRWLAPIIAVNKSQSLRHQLKQSLATITLDYIEALEQHLPWVLWQQLLSLARFAANQVRKIYPDSAIASCCDYSANHSLAIRRQFWLGISELLLTKKGSLRISVDKRQGFGVIKGDAHAQMMKAKMKALINSLSTQPTFITKLQQFGVTPPLDYEDSQWQIVSSLISLLPLAVAHLQLIFEQHGCVDFIEMAQRALMTLGDEQQPSSLALVLDYQIQHILVDEFQDTSLVQFWLLEKLTANWQQHDGKTLFVVGDPMQSIYRFRSAEVGLFLRAQQQGIGHVPLTAITLSQNFRATGNIVAWLNTTFANLFPKKNDMSSSAVAYMPATTNSKEASAFGVRCYVTTGLDKEAALVEQLAKKAQGTTAILVQSRSHLAAILPQLKASHLDYQAIEIEALSTHIITQDLLALTKALIHPVDSIAWLSVLRAPWCGLNLKALHIIAHNREQKTIWQRINHASVIAKLDENSQKRLLFVVSILKGAFHQYRRQALRDWVYHTWLALRGPQCLNSKHDGIVAESYFDLLETLDCGCDIKDFDELTTRLQALYANCSGNNTSILQVLTIHKAKGLEFDTVIVPGLGRRMAIDDKALLMCTQQMCHIHGTHHLLLAAADHSDSHDEIYCYLRYQSRLKQQHENKRLLYVAATRAKSALHLVGSISPSQHDGDVVKPAANSLLEVLWPLINQQYYLYNGKSLPTAMPLQDSEKNSAIKRLKSSCFGHTVTYQAQESNNTSRFQMKPWLASDNTPTIIGTIVHNILQQIATEGLQYWQQQRITNSQSAWRKLLVHHGVLSSQLDYALTEVTIAITNVLKDKTGQWLLGNHQQARSEFALTKALDHGYQHFVIDRSFVDDNYCWLIDYKIVLKKVQNSSLFLKQQQQYYHQQLVQYANIMRQFDHHYPIRLALYFPKQQIFLPIPVDLS